MFATLMTHDWNDFCRKILKFTQELGLSDLNLECDHTAIRVNSVALGDQLRNFFSDKGTIISENVINGRPILIIKLDEPLMLGTLSVPCIELPYPSGKAYPQEGWEHIELVIPSKAQSCEQLVEDVLFLAPQLAPHLNNETKVKVKLSSPSGEHERLPNPTIAFKKDNICIKLHPYSIQDIIESEQHDN
ncbi:VOC family protein [Parashewanella tropica]|uniref:VOC family protein n=1 Tax=Parashewanella tropica TaxID=2547970 RepID=UPI0010594C53|nr:VOC family protein [Parashewanella tropica]